MSGIFFSIVLLCLAYIVSGNSNDLLNRLQNLDEERNRLESEINLYREKYQHLLDLYNNLQNDEDHGTVGEDDEDVDGETANRIVKRATDCSSAAGKAVFHTRKSSTHNFITSKERIVFDSVYTNIGRGYESDQGSFVVPITGNYQFLATAMSTEDNYCEIEIYSTANGVLCRTRAGNSHQAMGTCSAMSQENSGTSVYVRGSGNGTVLYGEKYPSFSGHLISYN